VNLYTICVSRVGSVPLFKFLVWFGLVTMVRPQFQFGFELLTKNVFLAITSLFEEIS